jgi:hypothetical protein
VVGEKDVIVMSHEPETLRRLLLQPPGLLNVTTGTDEVGRCRVDMWSLLNSS